MKPITWSWSSTFLVVGGSFLVLIIVQAWSISFANRTAERLRSILTDSHIAVLEFERSIGYGGLIHNFKNYVLRSGEDGYRTMTLHDAEQALVMLDRLEASARSLDIDVPLLHARGMIETYSELLDQVRELAADETSARKIDARVRFDDEPALKEVGSVLSRMETAIDERVAELQRREAFAMLSSTAVTAAFGTFLVGFVALRKQRYTAELDVLYDTLSKSNGELQKANTSLRHFAGIVSHDLKTPLRQMSILGEFILEDRNDDEAVDSHLHALEQQTSEMASMIDCLLDFTETGFNEPQVRAFDFEHLLHEVERGLEIELESAGGSIESDVELDEPIRADPELLGRVFANLVGNSLKYSRPEEPPRIVVRAVAEGADIIVTVSDNGIGIEKRFADKIFEPMQRLHDQNSDYEGFGIGLSLVKSIVDSHGGTVWLDTTFVGGTRITFSLPRESRSQQRQAA